MTTYYQNFYKLQMAVMETSDNVLIFGPAASGKKDALERCIEEYGKDYKTALLTRKTALLNASYELDNVVCINWDKTVKNVEPDWLSTNQYDFVIIDGYCENWQELIEAYPGTRFIMSMRANTNSAIPEDLKQHFRIVAKCGFVDKENKVKGILSVRKYKG